MPFVRERRRGICAARGAYGEHAWGGECGRGWRASVERVRALSDGLEGVEVRRCSTDPEWGGGGLWRAYGASEDTGVCEGGEGRARGSCIGIIHTRWSVQPMMPQYGRGRSYSP